jgi:hypothetical protein
MPTRRCLKLLLPVLCALGLAAFAGATASPALAGVATGSVTDKYDNPIGGILVEALDYTTGAQLASAVSTDDGYFDFELLPVASGMYKVRISDPSGVYATTYLYDRTSFETADPVGYS